ncbi:MAG: SLC13/DASS family transporter [Sandaracinaceae bacterium]|nr:SLC13/DASS family transporter [Myxococcales bacterium]MCB9657940.1 SLC13/DASS family transporter [Sandaracinaceae bacterium]
MNALSLKPPRRGVFAAAFAAGAFVLVLLLPLSLEARAHRLLALFLAVIVLWVSEALPIAVTALLIPAGLVLLGITDQVTAFASFADPLLFLFVGGFFIAHAMTRHGLDLRIAGGIVRARWVQGSAARVRLGFVCAAVVLSMWVSNTASAAILVPILLGAGANEPRGASRSSEGSLLAVAYASSIGGLGTLVGSPPNLITARLLTSEGTHFGFLEWLALGLPMALVLAAAVYGVLALQLPATAQTAPSPTPNVPWSRAERVTAVSFVLAAVGWILPGVMRAAELPGHAEVARALPGGVVAVLASLPLFASKDDQGQPVLPWEDATRIEWGLILLFGGGIALGTQMIETGLARALSERFLVLTGVQDLWTLTACAAVFTVFFTETCSNTAAANIVVPLVIAAATQLDVSPVPPAMAVGLAASCAFMLPIATGPNAVVFATGAVRQTTMMRVGLVLNVICALVIVAWLRLALGADG